MNLDGPTTPPIVRWRNQAPVPRTFPFARYLARFILPFTPPITRWKLQALGLIAVWIAIQIGFVFYVNINVSGTRDVDNEVRWAAYIGQFILGILGLIPTSSGTEDRKSSALDFRAGVKQRAVIVDDKYAVSREGKWIGFHLVGARKVYRFFGVAAVEMPGRKYFLTPRALFPSRKEWRELQGELASR